MFMDALLIRKIANLVPCRSFRTTDPFQFISGEFAD